MISALLMRVEGFKVVNLNREKSVLATGSFIHNL
jgi:hypothetical protein